MEGKNDGWEGVDDVLGGVTNCRMGCGLAKEMRAELELHVMYH